MTQIVTIKITAKKADHTQMEQTLKDYMHYEHAHPEIFHYSSTRFYVKNSDQSPDEEIWLCIDHFNDYNDYLTSLKAAFETDPGTKQHYQATISHIVDADVDSQHVPSRDLWTEVDSLRVDSQGH